MLDALAFDAKIIHCKAEHDWSPHVFVQAGSELAFVTSGLEKTLLQQFVCKDACFGKAAHAFFDADMHPA